MGEILVEKTGEIFSDTLTIPTCGRQTGKILVKIGGEIYHIFGHKMCMDMFGSGSEPAGPSFSGNGIVWMVLFGVEWYCMDDHWIRLSV